MKRRSLLVEYFAILEEERLPAARAALAVIERDLAGLQEDAEDVILSELIPAPITGEAHGSGQVSDPTHRTFQALQRERARVSTERHALQADKLELQRLIREMEGIVRAVETWLARAGKRPLGRLTVAKVVQRLQHGDANEAIALAVGYTDESGLRKWLKKVDEDLRRLVDFSGSLRRAENFRPNAGRFASESARQGVLSY